MKGQCVVRQARTVATVGVTAALISVGALLCAPGNAAPPASADTAARLDPLQWAVVDSLRHPPRTTPAALLEAAIRAAAVEALEPTLEFLDQFDQALAGEADPDTTLAMLGEAVSAADLSRLERFLKNTAPPERAAATATLLDGMRTAARQRRTDPTRLAEAARALASDARTERLEAAETLSRGGTAALPALVDLLMQPPPAPGDLERAAAFVRTRRLARQLVGRLDTEGTRALIAWLGSADIDHFSGVMTALDVLVDRGSLPTGEPTPEASLDLVSVLLGPALISNAPEATRLAATTLLNKLASRGLAPAACSRQQLSVETGCRLLTEKLDRLLSPAGLPHANSLTESAAARGQPEPAVETYLWVDQTGRSEIRTLPPLVVRSLRAGHLSRDLSALGCDGPAAVRLVLLAQADSSLVFADDPATALTAIPAQELTDMLTGPAGYDPVLTAEVLDEAVGRGMPRAAAVAVRSLREQASGVPLELIRPPLVRATAMASDLVQDEAARTLAETAGTSPFPGSSRMLDRLIYAASATGVDRAVVAHPSQRVAQLLATGLSRFGYDVATATSGRDCLLAARQSPDVRFVLSSSRLPDLASRELIELLRQPTRGDQLPVLVVLDPLDDTRSGRHRTRLLLTTADFEHVQLTDRLESQFLPHLAAADSDAARVLQPRFPETLARVAGSQAADEGHRRRQAAYRVTGAAQALTLLGQLGRGGWNVTAALPAARSGLQQAETFDPALDLLAVMPLPQAQQVVFDLAWQGELPAVVREAAVTALEQSISSHGILLERRDVQNAVELYNAAVGADDQQIGRRIIALLTPPSRLALAADAQDPR